MNTPKFIYFDLGNVLLGFDHQRMLDQVAETTGAEVEMIRRVLFDEGLYEQYETGKLSSQAFYKQFCQQTSTCPGYDALAAAASDIFWMNLSILPVVAGLIEAGYRLGVLSNTCEVHWQYCLRRFRILREGLDTHALSYEIGARKPDRAIYEGAAKRAGVAPEEIFFTDDIADHIDAAREFGFDAVQYTSTPELVDELWRRGVRFNY